MNRAQFWLATLAAGCIAVAPAVDADEISTNYYEDDAWYDISEWFDGNDYNPTDEAIGRWDNETFEFSDDSTSADEDNDSNWGDYGYAEDSEPGDNRWFYDYYDDGYGDYYEGSEWSSYTLYDDLNNDGIYDSVSYYYDSDKDGIYDDYVFSRFDSQSDTESDAQSTGRDRQKSLSSRREQVAGTIEKTKTVTVRDRVHLIAHVRTDKGETVAVDLGPQAESSQVFEGDRLNATGHRVRVGEKMLLVASEARSKAVDLTIRRNGREYTGEITSTREVAVHGQKHLLAKVKTENGKALLVDLGPKDGWTNAPSKGDQVSVQGVPVKVKERIVLIARTLARDGETTDIKRHTKQSQT